MRPHVGAVLFFSAGLALAVPASAQEVVHALTGTVVSVNPQAKTITLNTDDGSEGTFVYPASQNVSLSFAKEVRDETTPPTSVAKPGNEVVVLFYGDNAERTVAAVRDLGAGPFVKAEGTVLKLNKHQRQIMIKDSTSGMTETFQIGPKAIADGTDGVQQGDRFEPDKGDDIHIVARKGNGGLTAVFLCE